MLSLLLTSLPEGSKEKRIVSDCYNDIKAHSRRNSRRDVILKAVSEGYDTCEEIAAETGIPQSSTYKIIKSLVQSKLIIEKVSKSSKNRKETRFEAVI